MEFIEYQDKQIPITESFSLTKKVSTKDNKELNKKNKFIRMAKLAKNLDNIISKLTKILETSKSIEDKQCAFSLLMMIETGIRVGNEDSAEGYICNIKGHALNGQKIQTFGLTSLLKEHLHFTSDNNKLYINFLGKKAVEQNIEINNPNLIKWALFFYKRNKESKKWLNINEFDLRKFVKNNIGKIYKVKDFRTLRANLTAGTKIIELQKNPLPEKKKQMSTEIKEITTTTANVLGNTPSICKTAYINPEIINWHILSRFPKFFDKPKPRKKKKQEKCKIKKVTNTKLDKEEKILN